MKSNALPDLCLLVYDVIFWWNLSLPEVNLNLIPGASDLTVLIKAVPIFKVSEVISPPFANSVPFSEKPADLITTLS